MGHLEIINHNNQSHEVSQKPPTILYKYRNFDARSISMLANDQMYIANPLDFNDPFDCVAHEHMFETYNPESLEMLARLYSTIPEENITRENTKKLFEAAQQHPEIKKIIIERKQANKDFLMKNGILCLSACNNSILMWSHYANYHKGFCIGFKNNIGLPQHLIKQVSYAKTINNDFVSFFLFSQTATKEEAHDNLLKTFIFTKYIDWQYEQEWRMIGEQGLAIYPPDCIDHIIFGLKMPIEERNTIRYILKNKNVTFFEAVKSKEPFSIEIRPINVTTSDYAKSTVSV
jgi:hypothetical protein